MSNLVLTASERIVGWRLSEGRPVPTIELFGALYATPDDEPTWVDSALKVMIHKLRDKLRPFGIEIMAWYGVGYRVESAHLAHMRDVLADEIARNVSFVEVPARIKIRRPEPEVMAA